MKKIISIILGIMLMFAMSVTSFAAKTDVITPNPETITFYVSCIDAVNAKDAEGKSLDDMIYTFSTVAVNQTKSNINLSDYPVALIFINDKTYETIDGVNVELADKWINANYQKVWADKDESNDWSDEFTPALVSGGTTNKVRMDYEDKTTVDIKVLVNGKAPEDDTAMIKTVGDTVVITLDVTPKAATPDAPTTETTTESTTKAPETSTEAPTESKPADTTTTTTPVVTRPAETTTTNAPADVDPEIPDTGATVPFAAIGTLVTSAITALVAKKKKEN